MGTARIAPSKATRHPESGFTLIEALVAMVLLAVGAVSLMAATEAHTRSVRQITDRVEARWIAESALAAHRLGLPVAPQITQLGKVWNVDILRQPLDAPGLVDVTVAVRTGRFKAAELRAILVDR